MTMATSWSYVPDDVYKPSGQLIHTLVDVVAKGGNFLLNVGPSPNGELPPDALARMRDIGAWLKINGEAIYKTRPVAPYKQENVCFTSLRDGTVFAIYLADENEVEPPTSISLTGIVPGENARLSLLGSSITLSWERTASSSQRSLWVKRIVVAPSLVSSKSISISWRVSLSSQIQVKASRLGGSISV